MLVRTQFSLISTGTEMMKISESKLSLVGKARARPDQVKKVMQSVSQQGLRATYRKVSDRLDSYTPLGYSLCGEVVEVGAGSRTWPSGSGSPAPATATPSMPSTTGSRATCACPCPRGRPEHAAFTTVGAIAMQGYRQSEARLGETACVIGLGLVGQLLVQILRAAGVNVVGLDPSPSGAGWPSGAARPPAARPIRPAAARCWRRWPPSPTAPGPTTSSSPPAVTPTSRSSSPPSWPATGPGSSTSASAASTCPGPSTTPRSWTSASPSYGPGRYDPTYEEGGVDYPIGYVRWTERRNMACFLDLVAEGRLDLDPLVSAVLPFDDAVGAYERIQRGEQGGVGMLFRYAANGSPQRRLATAGPPGARQPAQPVVRLGVIGAGNYATSMLLPHLRDRDDVRLVEVATATGLSATNAQRKFGFERCSTDHRGLLADEAVDAVLIATRHHAHAAMVCEALRAGKAVFVEKPLAVDPDQLQAILAAVADSGNDRLMVGFNRRFAPLLVDLKRAFGARSGPVQVRYDVNAGRLEAAAGTPSPRRARAWWGGLPLRRHHLVVARPGPGGGVRRRHRRPRRHREHAAVPRRVGRHHRLPDHRRPPRPKELFQVTGEGQVARLHNFQRTELWRGGRRQVRRSRTGIDKGQKQELDAFVRAVAEARPMPIPLASLVATTRATFAARRSLASRRLEAVADGGAAE